MLQEVMQRAAEKHFVGKGPLAGTGNVMRVTQAYVCFSLFYFLEHCATAGHAACGRAGPVGNRPMAGVGSMLPAGKQRW